MSIGNDRLTRVSQKAGRTAYNWTIAAAPLRGLPAVNGNTRLSKCRPDGTCLRSIAASLRSRLNRTGTSAIAERYT